MMQTTQGRSVSPRGTCGLVAMTSASHAEGRQFDPGQVYCRAIAMCDGCCRLETMSAHEAALEKASAQKRKLETERHPKHGLSRAALPPHAFIAQLVRPSLGAYDKVIVLPITSPSCPNMPSK